MQAQVLSQEEAAKRLANARHSRDATLPVMFFGTLEIGWLQVTLSALSIALLTLGAARSMCACSRCTGSSSSQSAERKIT